MVYSGTALLLVVVVVSSSSSSSLVTSYEIVFRNELRYIVLVTKKSLNNIQINKTNLRQK
jgi:hypothetical protein